jgi:hypothetical protein
MGGGKALVCVFCNVAVAIEHGIGTGGINKRRKEEGHTADSFFRVKKTKRGD